MSFLERFRGGPSPEEERADLRLELEAADQTLEKARLRIRGKDGELGPADMRDTPGHQHPGGQGKDREYLRTLEKQVEEIKEKISEHEKENPPFGGALNPYEAGKTELSEQPVPASDSVERPNADEEQTEYKKAA